MRSEPAGNHSEPSRFDRKNFAVGTVVSAVLIGLLGDGTIILFQARTPEEEGVNIGGAILGGLGAILAVILAAAVTARRARRRGAQPITEGVAAALAGFPLSALVVGLLLIPFLEVDEPLDYLPLDILFGQLSLMVLGIPAAYAGAALGGRARGEIAPR